MINGYLILLVINLVVPSLFEMLTSVKAEDMKLTASETAQLQPFADEAAKEVGLKMNPVFLFLLMTGTIYFSKFQAAK